MKTLAHCGEIAERLAAAGIRIGTAGWAIPRAHAAHFPENGTQLERYAQRFNAVEINSSFHRSHRVESYRRWAASVPDYFRFSVKAPKTITHERRLCDAHALLNGFLAEVNALGDKLGALLFQLPPSFALEKADASRFFALLRSQFDGDVVCEPRHATWFDTAATDIFCEYRIVRVAADPARVPGADRPGGLLDTAYYRLHGAPRMYYSNYDSSFLETVARLIAAKKSETVWSIFDNTTLGAATGNALFLATRLGPSTS